MDAWHFAHGSFPTYPLASGLAAGDGMRVIRQNGIAASRANTSAPKVIRLSHRDTMRRGSVITAGVPWSAAPVVASCRGPADSRDRCEAPLRSATSPR